MHVNKMAETTTFGSEFWNDSCDPKELAAAVAAGATGATSNPVLVATAIKNDPESWNSFIGSAIAGQPELTEDDLAWMCIEELGKKAASLLLPVFSQSEGLTGKLCLQVNPVYFNNAAKMIAHGRHLASLAPNIAVKVPVTQPGLTAIEELTASGISVNATVSFSVSQALACADAVEKGLEKLESRGGSAIPVTPWCTLMVGRIEDYLSSLATDRKVNLNPGDLQWSGVALFKKAHIIYTSHNYRTKLLAAAYRHHLHWSQFIGGKIVMSIPYPWWNRFNQSTIEAIPRIDLPVDESVEGRLRASLSEFSMLMDPHRLKPEEFVKLGASRNTLLQFLSGYDGLRQMVRSKMLSL